MRGESLNIEQAAISVAIGKTILAQTEMLEYLIKSGIRNVFSCKFFSDVGESSMTWRFEKSDDVHYFLWSDE